MEKIKSFFRDVQSSPFGVFRYLSFCLVFFFNKRIGRRVRSKRKAKMRIKEVIKPKVLFGPKDPKVKSPITEARVIVVI